MKISLSLTEDQVTAIARTLTAAATLTANPAKCSGADLTASNDILRTIVMQAMVMHGVHSTEAEELFNRDFATWSMNQIRRRCLPKSKHAGGPGQ